MHVAHDVRHPGERRIVGMDDEVDAVAEDPEVAVRDQRGDLDERVAPQVEAGHLAVDPHQTVVHPASLFATLRRRGRRHECERGSRLRLGQAQRIAAGYAAEGGALELGTVVVDGQVDPAARVRIPLAMLNRHGLVAGATGTGKTKTLQALAGQLSDAGRAGAAGRRQGRPVRDGPAGRGQPARPVAGDGHRRRLDAHGLPRRVPLPRRQELRRRRSARR